MQARCRWEAQLVWGHLYVCSFSGLLQGETSFLMWSCCPLQLLCMSDRFSFSQIAVEVIRPAGRSGMCLDLLLLNLAGMVLHWRFWGFYWEQQTNRTSCRSFIIETMHFLKICCRGARVAWCQTVPPACKSFSGQWVISSGPQLVINQSLESFEVLSQSPEPF